MVCRDLRLGSFARYMLRSRGEYAYLTELVYDVETWVMTRQVYWNSDCAIGSCYISPYEPHIVDGLKMRFRNRLRDAHPMRVGSGKKQSKAECGEGQYRPGKPRDSSQI